MKRRIRLTESGLYGVITESVRRVLAEGLFSKRLKHVAKTHGGIKRINKKYQLDKYEIPSDVEFIKDEWLDFGASQILKRFTEELCVFGDGSRFVVIKPQYMDDPKAREQIEAILRQSEDLSASRNVDYPGHTEYDRDYFEGWGWKDIPVKVSPEKERMKAHKAARGKKTRGLAKGSDRSYWQYVMNYLEQLAEKTGGHADKYDGYYYALFDVDEKGGLTPESKKLYDIFTKYGLQTMGSGYTDDNKLEVTFWDGTFWDYDPVRDRDVLRDTRGFFKRPKIGTTDFMNL